MEYFSPLPDVEPVGTYPNKLIAFLIGPKIIGTSCMLDIDNRFDTSVEKVSLGAAFVTNKAPNVRKHTNVISTILLSELVSQVRHLFIQGECLSYQLSI